MASPNVNFTEIVTTTLRNRQKQLADNVSNSNALLSRLNARGNIRLVPGGRTIVRELEYAENSTFQYYSGYETLNVAASDVFTAAEYDWKQAAVNVVASGLETRIQNSGPEAVINLLESRIRNAEPTMANQISIGVYSDGTGSNGKQVQGLQAQVAVAGTGTVGGINSTTHVWWRNQTSGDVANVFASAATLETEMADLWIETSRGNDKPDLIVADQNAFRAFWLSLTPSQRFTDSSSATKGFQSLKYVTADVVYDGDSGIRTDTMYFLNTNYLHWDVHAQTNMVPLERREPVNADAIVVPLVWAGNMTSSNRSVQGVLYT